MVACSFEHGVPATGDAKRVDAASDGKPADARICPAAPNGCTAFPCAGTASCYFVCGNAINRPPWLTAVGQCQAAGACLVTINSAAEQMCLTQQTMPSVQSPVWIGLGETAGGWGWRCGPASSYANWAPGQPMNQTGLETCAAMVDTGAWIAVRCDASARFVCEL